MKGVLFCGDTLHERNVIDRLFLIKIRNRHTFDVTLVVEV